MPTSLEFREPVSEAMIILDTLESRARGGVAAVSSTQVMQLIDAIRGYQALVEDARGLAEEVLVDIYRSEGIKGLPRHKYKKGATILWDRIQWVQRLEDLAGMSRGPEQDNERRKSNIGTGDDYDIR